MNFTVLAGAAENSEIRVEVKKFNYMMTDRTINIPCRRRRKAGGSLLTAANRVFPAMRDGDGIVTAADAPPVMRCALGNG